MFVIRPFSPLLYSPTTKMYHHLMGFALFFVASFNISYLPLYFCYDGMKAWAD